MDKKLGEILKRYEYLSAALADAEVIADVSTWQKYSKEQADLTETAEKYQEYLACESAHDVYWIGNRFWEIDERLSW